MWWFKRYIYLWNTEVDSPYGIEVGYEETKHKNQITNIIVENSNLIGNTVTGIMDGGNKENLLCVKKSQFKNNKIIKSKTPILLQK